MYATFFEVNSEAVYFPGRVPLSMFFVLMVFYFSSHKPDFLLMKLISIDFPSTFLSIGHFLCWQQSILYKVGTSECK